MSRDTRSNEARPKRVPVSADRAPLTVKGLDHKKFAYRWVKDVDDRIAAFLEGGYTFVDKTDASIPEPNVDTSKGLDNRRKKSAGGDSGVYLYFMKIPREFYEEDQKTKQLVVDETEQTMAHPAGKLKAAGVDYGKISMTRGDFEQG